MRRVQRDAVVLLLPSSVAVVGTLGALVGEAMNDPWVDPQAFGSAGAWFSGFSTVAALVFVILHRSDDASARDGIVRQQILGETIALEALLRADPAGTNPDTRIEISRVIGRMGALLADLPAGNDSNALFQRIMTLNAERSTRSRQECLDLTRKLVTTLTTNGAESVRTS